MSMKIQNSFAPSVVRLADVIETISARAPKMPEDAYAYLDAVRANMISSAKGLLARGHGLMSDDEMYRQAQELIKQRRALRLMKIEEKRRRAEERAMEQALAQIA